MVMKGAFGQMVRSFISFGQRRHCGPVMNGIIKVVNFESSGVMMA